MCQRLAMDFSGLKIMATLVNVCQRMISSWSIWYTDRYSLSTLSPLKRGAFYYLKTYDAKGIHGYPNVPLQPQVCSACLCRYFFAKVSPACKRKHRGWKSSSNGIERIFSFPWSLPYWMPALLRTAKNILRASWKTCRQKGKNQSVWYRWTKALESSWKSLRHGSASIFPKRIQNVGEKEIADRQLVYDFKDGRSHEAVAQMTAARMIEEHGSRCSQLVFILVLATSVRKNEPVHGLLQKGMWTHRSYKRIWPCKGMRRKARSSWEPQGWKGNQKGEHHRVWWRVV